MKLIEIRHGVTGFFLYDEEDVVDFGGDFDGESDDMQWVMSFNIKEEA